MNKNTYILIPRGPVRGIGVSVIYDECEIELNDFEALKVLLQGHILALAKDGTAVTVKDFVEDVNPQAILETVNLVPDVTAGNKVVDNSKCKVFGSPREFNPSTIEVKVEAADETKAEDPADNFMNPPETPSGETSSE